MSDPSATPPDHALGSLHEALDRGLIADDDVLLAAALGDTHACAILGEVATPPQTPEALLRRIEPWGKPWLIRAGIAAVRTFANLGGLPLSELADVLDLPLRGLDDPSAAASLDALAPHVEPSPLDGHTHPLDTKQPTCGYGPKPLAAHWHTLDLRARLAKGYDHAHFLSTKSLCLAALRRMSYAIRAPNDEVARWHIEPALDRAVEFVGGSSGEAHVVEHVRRQLLWQLVPGRRLSDDDVSALRPADLEPIVHRDRDEAEHAYATWQRDGLAESWGRAWRSAIQDRWVNGDSPVWRALLAHRTASLGRERDALAALVKAPVDGPWWTDLLELINRWHEAPIVDLQGASAEALAAAEGRMESPLAEYLRTWFFLVDSRLNPNVQDPFVRLTELYAAPAMDSVAALVFENQGNWTLGIRRDRLLSTDPPVIYSKGPKTKGPLLSSFLRYATQVQIAIGAAFDSGGPLGTLSPEVTGRLAETDLRKLRNSYSEITCPDLKSSPYKLFGDRDTLICFFGGWTFAASLTAEALARLDGLADGRWVE